MSYQKAEKRIRVPKSTIQRKVKHLKQDTYGKPTVFNQEEETISLQILAMTAD